MSTQNSNNNNTNNTGEELAAILKKLSDILDTSVSIDDAVDMLKKHQATLDNNVTPDVKASSSAEPPRESTEEEFNSFSIFGKNDTSAQNVSFDDFKLFDDTPENNASSDEEFKLFDNTQVDIQSFNELESLFETTEKIPEQKNVAESLQTGETVHKDKKDPISEFKKLFDKPLKKKDEPIPDVTTEEVSESQTVEFVPIEHTPPTDEDILFSQIFTEEKKGKANKERDRKKWQRGSKKDTSFALGLFDWVEVIVLSASFAFLLFTFILRLAVVDGNSMMNTLHNKEMLIISDLMYTPDNGDIIVCNSYGYPNPVVKRVIAKGGQTVDIDFENWVVTVDGKELDEPYVRKIDGAPMKDLGVSFPLTVPEGYVFVLGDNRNESLDSRDARIGLIDERHILGEVKFRIAPLDKFGKVD